MDVALQWPGTLDNAVMLAHAYEQHDTGAMSLGHTVGHALPWSSSPLSSSTMAHPQLLAEARANKLVTSVKLLKPVEIAQHQKDGQCFHYDEFFTNEHKQVCKQIFCIEVL
jgi:hypothetical protein